MSGRVGGAVVKFNQLTQSNCTRIPCGLHVLHLIADLLLQEMNDGYTLLQGIDNGYI